jgi:hypothetical protein
MESRPEGQAQGDFAYIGMLKDSSGYLRKAYASIMHASQVS